jgi:hypothetical protein
MNGKYVISNPMNGKPIERTFTEYNSYPRPTEYFDVYSPKISTLYSQVFWTQLDKVELPENIVKRFANKTMAVVGFEIDQVFKGENGGEDISVPINVAYNHHFESEMMGKGASLEKVVLNGPSDARAPKRGSLGHGRPEENVIYQIKGSNSDDVFGSKTVAPNHQGFGAGNGGEYRKSFHGYSPSYAQLIQSPESIYITPMQIDTWNRDKMNKTDPSGKFVSGPVPRNSLAPVTGKDAIYSGLLECPVTTRIQKVVTNAEYTLSISKPCAVTISSFSECFAAAEKIKPVECNNLQKKTINNANFPSGCTLSYNSKSNVATVVYNAHTAAPASKGTACGIDNVNITQISGKAKSLVEIATVVDRTKNEVQITMQGPSDVWYGVGFNATTMGDQPYTITIDGKSGKVTERKLGNHNPGSVIKSMVTILSNNVDKKNNLRTVVMTRKLLGITPEHYTFNVDVLELPFINAIGSQATFSYHKEKDAATLMMYPKNGGNACVCGAKHIPFGEAKGFLKYENSSIGFQNLCKPEPASDLLSEKNPTCDLRTYSGGQTACHHLWYLLDHDQTIPWKDQPLEYHLKFRFHFQEYNASYHRPIYRTTWGIASPVEYDVPQCPHGTPTEKCVHEIQGSFNVPKLNGQDIALISGHFHCHAPTCLQFDLFDNVTGALICREVPIYGGHSNGILEKKFDEQGYIAIPPCIFGNEEDGLLSPTIVSNRTLHAVKYANSTYGHHGEMAWLQVFVSPV